MSLLGNLLLTVRPSIAVVVTTFNRMSHNIVDHISTKLLYVEPR